MSLKNSTTRSDALQWNEALSLISKLERDQDITFALLIASGVFLGLRISDLLTLTYENLLAESFELIEKKTGKHRRLTVNPQLREIVKRNQKAGLIFTGRSGKHFTVQYANNQLKKIARKYGIKGNFSGHSLRKGFGRHVWEQNGCSEKALVYLSKIFNHVGTDTTRTYLGITADDISDIYMNL